MAAYTMIAMGSSETTLNNTNCTLSVKTMGGTSVTTGDWTITHHSGGFYSLYVPGVTEMSTYYIYKTADSTVYCSGTIGDEFATWSAASRTLTRGSTGSGSVLYTWTEYQNGHSGDGDYVVPDVTVTVYNNNTATGLPMASGVTDEDGQVSLYLDAGTYYVFRRKAGRQFTNPSTITVS